MMIEALDPCLFDRLKFRIEIIQPLANVALVGLCGVIPRGIIKRQGDLKKVISFLEANLSLNILLVLPVTRRKLRCYFFENLKKYIPKNCHCF